MGIKFGEIDANQILENEFRINVLERVIDWIFRNNPDRLRLPNAQVMLEIRREVVKELQKKYPLSGIQLKEQIEQAVAG